MKDETLARKIGELVRKLRLEAGMSQEDFADRCGLHRTYIGSIERGEKTITLETTRKLTLALEISLAQFFTLLEKDLPN